MTLKRKSNGIHRPGLQAGQAIVEYAIISLLLVLLIAGGTELGIAAFNSNRTAEGAKTASVDWMESALINTVYDTVSGNFFLDTNDNGAADPVDDNGLGDHENFDGSSGGFNVPQCDGLGGVNTGIPADDNFYLFNPKFIDITDCLNQDEINALMDALPPLHNSVRSLYQEYCANAMTLQLEPFGSDCDLGGDDIRIMKFPGVMDIVNETQEITILDAGDNFVRIPVFELECAPLNTGNFTDCDTREAPADICWDIETFVAGPPAESLPLACNLRVLFRHRHVFESFLIMQDWGDPVPVANLDDFDPGPNGPGNVGSELSRGDIRKANRTFLGCYETTILAIQDNIISIDTTSCN